MPVPYKVLAKVKSIVPYGEDVYEVNFIVPKRNTKFLPGQFLHLTLDSYDPTEGYWPESRVFSIASYPNQEILSIVYSVKGFYTRRMRDELLVDSEVWLKLPYGNFVISETLRESGPIILIAGGTGVSPYLPFLLQDRADGMPIHLYYGVRQAEHILFSEIWSELSQKPWFHFHLFIENKVHSVLPSRQGRLSIETVISDFGSKEGCGNIFLSGPPGMITKFKTDLLNIGFSSDKIHKDEWE